jgi:hypothetical protein
VDALVHFVCDAHTVGDGVGPFITRRGEKWAFCPGNGADDHSWREIEPVTRGALEQSLRMPRPEDQHATGASAAPGAGDGEVA